MEAENRLRFGKMVLTNIGASDTNYTNYDELHEMNMTENKKRLIRKLHTVCSSRGITAEERRIMYEQYGVDSSTLMAESEINELIQQITGQVQNQNNRSDLLRKRVMAVVFNFYKLKHMEVSREYVIATIVRASGYKFFNAIPDGILNNLYNAFLDKNRNRVSVTDIDNQLTGYLQSCN